MMQVTAKSKFILLALKNLHIARASGSLCAMCRIGEVGILIPQNITMKYFHGIITNSWHQILLTHLFMWFNAKKKIENVPTPKLPNCEK